jgi:hypothetical protein
MRWLGLVILVSIASRAHAAPPSNPAFLGIEMQSSFVPGAGPSPTPVGCLVRGVTRGSAAEDAGVRMYDLILALDKRSTTTGEQPPCDLLREAIVARAPGDLVRLDIRRGGEAVGIEVVLSTRADVLQRRFVGHTMEPAQLVDADDVGRTIALDLPIRTTLVGWFMADRCVGCGAVFDKLHERLRRRLRDRDTVPAVLAATAVQDLEELKPVRRAFVSSVPLAIAPARSLDDLALRDPERITFMLIDCAGIVRFVMPIAPDSDDLDVALDEVLAAAEQAEHARTLRR